MAPTKTCSYTYETLSHTAPADAVPLPEPTETSCPHPASSSTDGRCIFHSSDRDFPPTAISSAFQAGVRADDRDGVFAGGRITDLTLADEELTTPDGSPIDLRGVTIDGSLSLEQATVTVPLLLGNAAITGDLNLAGATFTEPVSLAGADIGGQLTFHDTDIDGGIAANGLNAGFVDARGLTVNGPAIFREASFNANTRFARSTFNGDLSFADAEWRLLADFAATSIAGTAEFTRVSVGGDLRMNAATVRSAVILTGASVDGETRFSHSVLHGDLIAKDASFEGECDFEDLRSTGTLVDFENAEFGGYTTFSLSEIDGAVRFAEARFSDEFWFTHVTCASDVTFRGSRGEAFVHLRDSTFNSDLTLSDAEFAHQSFLAGSTIAGDLNARQARFEHFQFSATVNGTADFRKTLFDARSIFTNSVFNQQVWFDNASFAGGPDFSDSTFKRAVSFTDTEFLVEPTFSDARFGIEPDLDAAEYPQSSSAELASDRRNLIVARPEDLLHYGHTLPVSAVEDDIVVPAAGVEIFEVPVSRAKMVTAALNELDQSAWYQRFDRSVELARTAISQLELSSDQRAELVFGVTVDPDAENAESYLQEARLVAAYTKSDGSDTFTFSYLDEDLAPIDHMITISSADDAFEYGPSVGTHLEYRTAIFRRQLFEQTLLEQGNSDSQYSLDAVPALVAISRL